MSAPRPAIPPLHGLTLALLVGALAWPSPTLAQAEVGPVDRAMAVVGDRVVTASEVAIAATLDARDPGALELAARGARQPAEWWVEQVLLRELAGDIGVYQPDPAQVRDRTERLLAAFDPAELAELEARLGLDRDALQAWVHGRLVVERYVHRNIALAAEAALEDAVATRVRYQAWVAELRDSVEMRRIGRVTWR
jgi:hypothetical protein